MGLFLPLLFFFGSFIEPTGLDSDIEGNLYVVDAGRDLVIKYSTMGDSLDAVGGYGSGTDEFDRPVAIYAGRGTDVFVVDHNNHRIQRFNRQLDYVTTIFTRNNSDERTRFGYPRDVAVSRQGDILVLDGENHRVLVLNALGEYLRSFGDVTSGEGRLTDPLALELDNNDNVYVLDMGEINIYDPFGAWLRVIPLPEANSCDAFSIGGDSLAILADSLLFFYQIEDDVIGNQISPNFTSTPVAIHYHAGILYSIEVDHVDVLKLPSSENTMLQGE